MTATIWTGCYVGTLIAWLDFCVQTGVDFDDTIIEQLRKTAAREGNEGFTFTPVQVANKLINLARRTTIPKGKIPFPTSKDVRAKGSVCFPALRDDIRQEVDTQLMAFHQENAGTRPARPNNPQTDYQAPNTANETTGPQPHETGNEMSGAAEARTMQASHAPRSQVRQGLLERSNPRLSNTSPRRGDNRNNDQLSEVPMLQLEDYSFGSREELTHAFESQIWQEWEDIASLSNPQERHRVGGTDRELARLQALWKQEVEALRADKVELEKKNARLEAHKQCLESARQAREQAGNDPLESEFYYQGRCIWNLREKNHALEQVADFFREVPSQPRSLSAEDIDEAIDEIGRELESMFANGEPNIQSLPSTVFHGADMESLLRSGLGLRVREVCQPSLLAELISNMHPCVVVRSLALAALKDWVLYTSYPSFVPDGTSCSMLRSYRDIAMEFGGWKSLRNYDAAAYKRMIESSQFQEELLPREAVSLTHRLMKVVAPLCIAMPRNGEDDISEGSQAFELYKDLRFRFVEMFKIGLKFKAATVLTDVRYEFLINPPGTLNTTVSTPETLRVLPNTPEQSCGSSNAGAWLHASLNVYAQGLSNPHDRQSDAIVQQLNFTSKNIGMDLGEPLHTKTISIANAESANRPSSLEPGSGSQDHLNGPVTSSTGGNSQGSILQTAEGRASSRENSNARQQITEIPIESESVGAADRLAEAQPDGDPRNVHSRVEDLATQYNSLGKNSSLPDILSVNDLNDLKRSDTFTKGVKQVDKGNEDEPSGKSSNGFECDGCKYNFTTKPNLIRHIQSKSCSFCIKCNRRFASRMYLDKHRQLEHSNKVAQSEPVPQHQPIPQNQPILQSQPFPQSQARKRVKPQCDRCGRGFKRQHGLDKHVKLKRCAKCFICNAMFTRVDLLRLHHLKTHMPDNSISLPNPDIPDLDSQMALGIDNDATENSKRRSEGSLGLHSPDYQDRGGTISPRSHTIGSTRSSSSQPAPRSPHSLSPKRRRVGYSNPGLQNSGDGLEGAQKTAGPEQAALKSAGTVMARMQREPTPDSRHIARIIALVSKADEDITHDAVFNGPKIDTTPCDSGGSPAGIQGDDVQTSGESQGSK